MEEVKSFLEEGYDFIDEGCSAVPLEFIEADKDIIVESNGEKSPFHTLGVCRGVFQPINEPSRNMRIYESRHWEIQLSKPEVQERLKTRSMWGTLGHFDRKISDLDIREGLVSHIITKLEIREDDNKKPYLYGELEILDTPAGRILEGMYKGGANLFVSSRGAGKLITVNGDPMKHVDPNSFWFEGFDIVRAPGFVKARPVYESTVSEDEKVHESKEEPKQESANLTESTVQPTNESSELQSLQSQISKLTKIIEKVVDDVYEVEEASQEQPTNETEEQPQPTNEDKQEQSKKALAEAVDILLASKIEKSTLKGILEELVKAKKQS